MRGNHCSRSFRRRAVVRLPSQDVRIRRMKGGRAAFADGAVCATLGKSPLVRSRAFGIVRDFRDARQSLIAQFLPSRAVAPAACRAAVLRSPMALSTLRRVNRRLCNRVFAIGRDFQDTRQSLLAQFAPSRDVCFRRMKGGRVARRWRGVRSAE